MVESQEASIEDENNDSQQENSPEAAGLARGTAKTAATLSKRAAVGRLPKAVEAAKVASRKAAKIASKRRNPAARVPSSRALRAPKRLPRRARLQRVAKTSDGLSTGFDVYDAATSVTESSPKGLSMKKKRLPMERIFSPSRK